MTGWARRLAMRLSSPMARRVLLMLCIWQALPATAEVIIGARYTAPTDRYPHAVLGDELEYTALVLRLSTGTSRHFTLPDTSVFEDMSPRLVDLDSDGAPEVLTVESDQQRGARLAVYNAGGRIASTPYIGARFRWLALLGAADLDGDGMIEIAYVDRPHLAKTLRLWRFVDGALTAIGSYPGVTNHRIGERDIAGGIRLCGDMPEMVVADADWSTLLALRYDGKGISVKAIAEDTSRESFARAMACESLN